jgi:hypothetical protein
MPPAAGRGGRPGCCGKGSWTSPRRLVQRAPSVAGLRGSGSTSRPVEPVRPAVPSRVAGPERSTGPVGRATAAPAAPCPISRGASRRGGRRFARCGLLAGGDRSAGRIRGQRIADAIAHPREAAPHLTAAGPGGSVPGALDSVLAVPRGRRPQVADALARGRRGLDDGRSRRRGWRPSSAELGSRGLAGASRSALFTTNTSAIPRMPAWPPTRRRPIPGPRPPAWCLVAPATSTSAADARSPTITTLCPPRPGSDYSGAASLSRQVPPRRHRADATRQIGASLHPQRSLAGSAGEQRRQVSQHGHRRSSARAARTVRSGLDLPAPGGTVMPIVAAFPRGRVVPADRAASSGAPSSTGGDRPGRPGGRRPGPVPPGHHVSPLTAKGTRAARWRPSVDGGLVGAKAPPVPERRPHHLPARSHTARKRLARGS